MKKLFAFILTVAAVATAWAGDKTVVFQPGVDMGASYVVKDGVTVNYIMDFIYLDDSMVMLSLGSPSTFDISGIEAVSDSVRVNK